MLEYAPGHWERPTYDGRQFFDWGGWLAVRPMHELPHWRVVMRREREENDRRRSMAAEHAAAIQEMRALLSRRPTVANRDFAMAGRTRTNDFRARKDSSVALYYLWRTGEVMTHHRVNFERVYALTEPGGSVPSRVRKRRSRGRPVFSPQGDWLSRAGPVQSEQRCVFPRASYTKKEALAGLLDDGEVVEVKIEGWRGVTTPWPTMSPR